MTPPGGGVAAWDKPGSSEAQWPPAGTATIPVVCVLLGTFVATHNMNHSMQNVIAAHNLVKVLFLV